LTHYHRRQPQQQQQHKMGSRIMHLRSRHLRQ
jgi:hypothetical protein